MKKKYNEIWRSLDGVSGHVRSSELPDLLLAEISQRNGMAAEKSERAFIALEALRKTDG